MNTHEDEVRDILRAAKEVVDEAFITPEDMRHLAEHYDTPQDLLEMLARISGEENKPILTSSDRGVVFILPDGWTHERIRGYIGGIVAKTEDEYNLGEIGIMEYTP